MTRTYELGFIIDPRVSDEDAATMASEYREMLESGGAKVTKEESWGKRKLAYEINKLTEGRYIFFFLDVEAGAPTPFPAVERRMAQNEKILRYLTVRTDLDLKRQASKGKKQPEADEATGTDG